MRRIRRLHVCGAAVMLLTAGCTAAADRSASTSTSISASDTVGAPISSAIALRPNAAMRDPEAEAARDPRLAHHAIGDSVRLEMVVQAGDQINALQPPVLTYDNGRRLRFGGSAITADSAYFVGAVTATVPRSALPVRGRLVTSYCRAGEKLCRSATRDVVIE